MNRSLSLAAALLVAFPVAATVPAGFTDTLVAAIAAPTALAFTPDGRLLVCQQTGSLRIVQGGTLLPAPALTFPASQICTNNERGLLGVAVDPDFATNRHIYLYYTFNRFNACPTGNPGHASNPANRVSRFVLQDTNVVDPASELVLIDNMPSPIGNHNGGDVQFGKDGYLYVTIGDGAVLGTSRSEHILAGKVLRITADGGIPPSNPFQGPGTARCNVTGSTSPGMRCQETFAWGLRNPWRLAFDPDAADTVFRINDVGQNTWEEIDLGLPGVDYGYNCREGAHPYTTFGVCQPPPPAMVDPVFEYQHGQPVPGTSSPSNCTSITGGAFVPGGVWPGFDGAYLFQDLVCGGIFRLDGSGAGPYVASDFASGLGNPVTMLFGPHGATQALYYTVYSSGGQLRRIASNVVGNNAPIAVATGAPLSGPAPLEVTFDASGSSDPDAGDTLTYFFTFGDGTPETSTASPTIPHTYTSVGTFTASLRVRDNHMLFSTPVTLQVQPGNSPPVPTITSPVAGLTFSVNETLTLSGTATDPQDGALPPASLSWTVLRRHDVHTHPYLGPVPGTGITLSAPPPEDFVSTQNSYLEIFLTATDAHGLTTTIQQNMLPALVNLTFQTVPPGLSVVAGPAALATPQTVVSWAGYDIAVDAPAQSVDGTPYRFVSWSDGGAQGHTITTPASAATYTATFAVDSQNTAPTLSPAAPLARSRGATGSSATIATVGDAESPAGNLTVTVVSAPPDIGLSGIANAAGTVSAIVSAGCGAALGNASVVLQVSDGSLTSTASLTVTVTPNLVPPAVTPPSPATAVVNQTLCAGGVPGATPATLQARFPDQHADLLALLGGGSAVDDCTSPPARLTPRLGGADVIDTTFFPAGSSTVLIRFADADGNEGSAVVTVTVRRQGDVDENDLVDVADTLIVMNQIVGNIEAGTTPFTAELSVADVDGNGEVDILDVVRHMGHIVGNIPCLTP